MLSYLSGGKFFGLLFGGAVVLSVVTRIAPALGIFLMLGYSIFAVMLVAKRGEAIGMSPALAGGLYVGFSFLGIGFPALLVLNLILILVLTFKNGKQ